MTDEKSIQPMQNKDKPPSISQKIKETLFEVLIILLNDTEMSLFVDSLFVYSEYFQWIGFPFHPTFDYIWKKQYILEQINKFINYFQITVYFTDNGSLFILFFYGCVIIVILMIINLIYVIVSVIRKKFQWVWPLRTLRSVASFIVTIFFMPIFEVFIAMLQCDDNNGKLTLTYDPSLTCWKGSHIVHVIFAIIFSVFFVIICTVIQLCYFDCRFSINDHGARSSSRADSFLVITKIIQILFMYYAFAIREIHWIIIILQWVISYFMFYFYYAYHPYYNESANTMRVISNGLYLWSNTVLLIGKILENSEFNAGIELVLVGSIFFILYILLTRTNRLKSLLKDIKLIHDKNEVLNQVNHLLALIELKDSDRSSRHQLNGYIYTLVANSEEGVYNYLTSYIETKETRNIESNSYLYQHVKFLYQEGLKLFPNSAQLRISYAYFLLDTVKNKKLALEQLHIASMYNPYFDEQFTIYRCKKLIDESNAQESINLDLISNIAYTNYLNQFKSGIFRTSELYLEFWTLLLNPNHQENHENLAKLNELGTKINQVIADEVTTSYRRMKEIKQVDYYATKLYAEFLSQILNEKEKANEFKRILEEMEFNTNQIDSTNNNELNINIIVEAENTMMISADHENIGNIINVSTGICKLLGFTKKDLNGVPLDLILPNGFIEEHKRILIQKAFDYKNEINDNIGSTSLTSKYEIKHKQIIAMMKSRYMYLFDPKITLTYSTLQSGFIYFCKLNNIKTIDNQNICHLFLNADLSIYSCTTNSKFITGIDIKDIQSKNLSIVDFILEFQHEGFMLSSDKNSNADDAYLSHIEQYLFDNFLNSSRIKFIKGSLGTGEDSKYNNFEENKTNNFSKITASNLINKNTFNQTKNQTKQQQRASPQICSMLLKVDIIKINNVLYGYLFSFENVSVESKSETLNLQKDIQITKEIKDNYIPEVLKSMTFNLKNCCFTKSASSTNEKFEMKQLALDKFKHYKEEQERKKKRENLAEGEEISEEEYLEEEEEEDDDGDSNNSIDGLDQNIIKLIDVKKDDEDKIIEQKESVEESPIKDKDKENYTNPLSHNRKNSKAANYLHNDDVVKKKTLNEYLQKQSYVRLDLGTVKLFKFAYSHNKIMKVTNKFIKSKLEQVLEYSINSHMQKQKQIIQSKKDEKVHKKDPSNTEKNINSLTQTSTNEVNQEQSINKSHYNLIKQIEFSLSKEEDQQSITYFKIVSFVLFVILLGLHLTIFLTILSLSYTNQKNIILFESSTQSYISNYKKLLFYSRSIMIKNNNNITGKNVLIDDGFLESIYVQSLDTEIQTVFKNSTSFIYNYINGFVEYVDEAVVNNTNNIKEDFLFNIDVNKAKQDQQYTMNLISFLSKMNHYFLKVSKTPVNDILDSSPLLIKIFHFFYNEFYTSMNYLLENINTLKSEGLTNYLINTGIIIGCFLLFYVISTVLLNFMYINIEKRKESYLEVFLEIGEKTIQISINKCEEFNKKFSSDEISENKSADFNQKIINEESQPIKNNKLPGVRDKKSSSSNMKHYGIKALVGIPFFILFCLIISAYLNIYSVLNDQISKSELIKKFRMQQNYILDSYNALREYLSEDIKYINNTDIKSFTFKHLDEYFDVKKIIDDDIKTYYGKFSDFNNIFLNTNYYNACGVSSKITNFTNDLLGIGNALQYYEDPNCPFIQISNQSTGLIVFVGKIKERLVEILDERVDFPNKSKNEILTNDKIKELTLIISLVVNPAFDFLCDFLLDSINSTYTSLQMFIIVYFVALIVIIFLVYIGYWRSFLNELKTTIYKTKNMLSIIPKEVLASLSTIPKLLDIKDNRRGLVR